MFNLAISLILIHFLSDWIMQPRWMAEQKSSNFGICSYHGLITGLFLLLVYGINSMYGLKINWVMALLAAGLYTITHILQDWFVWRIYKKYRDTKKEFQSDYWFYSTIAIDQAVHLVLMFALTSLAIEMS